MNALEITGWIAVVALAVVLVGQSRSMRSFVRPRRADLDTWPSVSVVIAANAPDADVRRTHAELTHLGYEGKLEILIAAVRDDDITSLETLTLASHRTRIIIVDSEAPERSAVIDEAAGQLLLFIPPRCHVEPDTVSRLVSEALRDDDRSAVVLPRLESRWSTLLAEPMLPWLQLTFSPMSAYRTAFESSCILLVRRDAPIASQPQVFDGYDSVTREPMSRARLLHAFRTSVGRTTAHRFTAAIVLLTLFTTPPVVALTTESFPWIVATVVSYWLRFRVAARTGEPLPAALLHPIASLVVAVALLGGENIETAASSSRI